MNLIKIYSCFIFFCISCNVSNDNKMEKIIDIGGGNKNVKHYNENGVMINDYIIDSNNKKDGFYKEYYENGGLKSYSNFSRNSLSAISSRGNKR